ncbi:MAG TPA: hypothetical protein DEB06_08790 [Phycisphaerales bacterium]|nr:hypothetical protein [Phycisphaerales bacterium]
MPPFNPPSSPDHPPAPGSNGDHAPGPDWGQIQRLVTLGTLAGSIAHEFNNILTPVLSYAQLAQSSPDDRDLVNKALRKASEGAEKAAEIASAMLGLIRDGDGAASCSVAEAAREALGCLARSPEKDGVRIEIDIPETLAVIMRPVALQQVLLNLLLNALDAVRQRSGVIRVCEGSPDCSTWNIPNASGPGKSSGGIPGGNGNGSRKAHAVPLVEGMAVIRVSDNGCGISAAQMGRLFEPFRSVKGAGSTRSGTGLGLAITKRLIEEAGGRIAVESAVGEGTTFSLLLPRAAPGAARTNWAA